MPGISDFINAIGPDSALLTFNRGIEREALRVTPEGQLAQTPHPEFLGSKLTHPSITTDFSEAQLELITPVHQSPEESLAELDRIHRYIYSGLEDEILWSASMPCLLQESLLQESVLSEASAIPLAYYGDSNLGRLKHTYRHGLGIRYGRGMQTICAVHYNFSFNDQMLIWLKDLEKSQETLSDFRTRRYFDLMRNFRRYSWLLTYLFGASPAVCNSFVRNRDHSLQAFDEGTAYLPYATSLRSGGLGYQSDIQANHVNVSYNSNREYVTSIADAITTSYPGYTDLGLKQGDQYLQVNDCLLQSEAEFYSSVRAKCVPPKGANFLAHLLDGGVQYVEVRLLDVNPYLPLGIDESTIRFIDTFLLYCLLEDSPLHDSEITKEIGANALTTVYEGRAPDVTLVDRGQTRSLKAWGQAILDAMAPVASLLDEASGNSAHSPHMDSHSLQADRLSEPDKTPSGRILKDMQSEGIPFFRFAMNQALSHQESFKQQSTSADEKQHFDNLATESRAQQAAIETAESESFDNYLKAVNDAYLPLRSQ